MDVYSDIRVFGLSFGEENYSEDEITQLDNHINHKRDETFTYVAMEQWRGKYLVQNRVTGEIYETPQIRYAVAAATAFHKMRLKLIGAARAELERRLFKGEEVPEDWRFLLEKDMRTRLHNTFNEVILPAWSGRGRTPSCF